MDSGLHILASSLVILVSGTWILDHYRFWDSRFLELYSGFQVLVFRIPQAKVSRIHPSPLPTLLVSQLNTCRVKQDQLRTASVIQHYFSYSETSLLRWAFPKLA